MGRATSFYSLGSQLGTSTGVALVAAVLAARMAAYHAEPGNPRTAPGAWAAFHASFAAAVLIAIVGMRIALLVSDRLATLSLRRDGANASSR